MTEERSSDQHDPDARLSSAHAVGQSAEDLDYAESSQMRFVADGPNIPDGLLNARDTGRVVFLCGAGVSIPAGMPSFVELVQKVLSRLRAPSDAPARQAFSPWEDRSLPVSARAPLDQVFNTLREDYGRDQINRLSPI